MNIRHIYDHLTGKTKAKAPAKITLRNVYAVLQSFIRKTRRGLGGFDLPKSLYEQIIWRRTQVMEKSPECWKSGSCTQCGCEMIGKTMEDRPCDNACYPEMMNETTWELYKKDNKINLFE